MLIMDYLHLQPGMAGQPCAQGFKNCFLGCKEGGQAGRALGAWGQLGQFPAGKQPLPQSGAALNRICHPSYFNAVNTNADYQGRPPPQFASSNYSIFSIHYGTLI